MKLNPKISCHRRKSRKKFFNSQNKKKEIFVSLSSELKNKYGIKRFNLRKEDQVKIMSGSKNLRIEGKVIRCLPKKGLVGIEGIIYSKLAGRSSIRYIHHSNLRIISFDLSDKKRLKVLNFPK